MKRKIVLGIGAGLAALAALPGHSQTTGDAALEAACRATEVTSPASCSCTITKARAVGVTDAQLASLFKDDGHSSPVPQATYSRFWQVKSQCIADAMMASLGVSPDTPLPGVPAHMRPKPPGAVQGTGQGAPVVAGPPPYARPLPANRPPVGTIATPAADASKSGPRTRADIDALIARLAGTAWEYTDENGRYHRFDFLPEGKLAVYQQRDAEPNGFRLTEVFQLSADENRFTAFIRTRDVTTGQIGDLPINALTDSALIYQKRYVRSGEEWRFTKAGAASETLPEGAPQRLEDGFWKVRFNPVSKNPAILGQNRLSGIAGPANRTLRTSGLAGAPGSSFLVGDQTSEECRSNCFFVVNELDRRTRRVRHLIEEAGVDHVGVRLEPSQASANRVSVRAFDGYGGWKEWLCTGQNLALDCRKTGAKEAPQARPAAAREGSGALLAQLGAVSGATWGDAACSADLYLFPADGRMPQGTDALFAHIRTQKSSHFATLVDTAPPGTLGYKLNLNGREATLPAVREGDTQSEYSNGAFTLRLTKVGPAITNPREPSYAFQRLRAEIVAGNDSESFDAIGLDAC